METLILKMTLPNRNNKKIKVKFLQEIMNLEDKTVILIIQFLNFPKIGVCGIYFRMRIN